MAYDPAKTKIDEPAGTLFKPTYYQTGQTTTTTPSYTQRTTPTYQSRTETAMPTMPRPEMGALPQYEKPEYDTERVGELREIAMGVPMSRLRRALNRTVMETRYAGNKALRAEMTRQALSGYGAGVSEIGLGAQKEAISQYGPEYEAEREKATRTYAASLEKYRTQFASDMQEYLTTMKRTQTTRGSQTQYVPGGTTTTTKSTYAMNPTIAKARGA